MVYVLFFVPLILFVLAFVYETYLSFARLKNPKAGKSGYVSATWEVTHTLLVFSVVMLVMLFSQSIDVLADKIFLTTFIAALALGVRAVCYIYIFYVRSSNKTDLIDWSFALSHVVAALFLVLTVLKAVWVLYKDHPIANENFVLPFIPGLIFVVTICAVPMLTLYKSK